MEDNEDTSFCCDISVCVPMSCIRSMVQDWCIHWNSWYSDMFSHWDEQRKVCTKECECVFVAGWMSWMCKLECSVWHTEMPPGSMLTRQAQFNLDCLTTHGSIQKGTQRPVHLFFFSRLLSIFFLHQSLLYLKSNCRLCLYSFQMQFVSRLDCK